MGREGSTAGFLGGLSTPRHNAGGGGGSDNPGVGGGGGGGGSGRSFDVCM